VWIRKAQGTVLDRARISDEKGTFWEIVILGHIQTCNACGRYYQPYSQSGSNDVASGYNFYSNLFILLFSGTVYRAVLVACNLE